MKRIFRSMVALQSMLWLSAAPYANAQSNTHSSSITTQQMNTEAKNKEVVRHMYEDILNTGRLDLLSEVIGDNYTGNAGEKGPEGAAVTVGAVIKGFPDIKWKIEDLIAEGDKVVIKWSWDGTHTGNFQGYPITHNPVHNNAIAVYQLANGKIVKVWMQTDRLGFLQQIGVASKDLGIPPKK